MAHHQPQPTMEDQEMRPFRFLDLPREIRDRVYEYLLEADRVLCLHASAEQRVELHPPTIIHKEATPALYANNVFAVYGLSFWHPQIRDSFKYVRTIIFGRCITTKTTFRSNLVKLKEAKQLRALIIEDPFTRSCQPSELLAQYRTPEDFAKTIGPLERELHRAQKKDSERKVRNVLDVIQFRFSKPRLDWLASTDLDTAARERTCDKYEADVKAILAKTLK